MAAGIKAVFRDGSLASTHRWCIIGICTLSPNIDATKATAALGLASTAIAGAAGLAQSGGKHEFDFSVNKDGEKLQIKPPV